MLFFRDELVMMCVRQVAWVCAAVLLAAGRAAAQEGGDPVTVKGKVVSLNRGGNGSVEGIVVDGGRGVVQVNMPPEMAGAVMKTVAVGDVVEVVGRKGGPGGRGRGGPRGDGGPGGRGGPAGRGEVKPEHEVYELVQLTDAKGKQYVNEGPGGRERVTVDGIVAAFNYNREGVTDGLQLENGDLVRLGPAGVGIAIRVGQRIVVEGTVRAIPTGGRMIEPATINGVEVKREPGPGGPGGRGGRGGGPGAEDGPPPPPDRGPPPPPPDDGGPPPPPDDGFGPGMNADGGGWGAEQGNWGNWGGDAPDGGGGEAP